MNWLKNKVMRIDLVGRNTLANGAGRLAIMLVNFAVVPVYLRLVGLEAYGIIAFYTTLFVLAAAFDLGVGAALTRLFAQNGADAEQAPTILRSLEVLAACIAVMIAGLVMAVSAPIAQHWLGDSSVAPATITQAIRAMGFAIALQWLANFYYSGLDGLQMQARASGQQVAMTMIRSAGAVAVLLLASGNLITFFVWQASVGLAEVLWVRGILRAQLTVGRPARFDTAVVRRVRGFAGGMAGASMFQALLGQIDKIILSMVVPLSDFALYMLAWSLASAGGFMSMPLMRATIPNLTTLAQSRDRPPLIRAMIRQAWRIAPLAAIPCALIAVFAAPIISFWTQDPTLTVAAPMARALALGAFMNALLVPPYALVVAQGRARLAMWSAAVAVAIMAPVVWCLAQMGGAPWAAWGWPLINLGFLLVFVPLALRSDPHEAAHSFKP